MKIIYIYDALCGWCYGFTSVINEFHEKYQNQADFEVISGGMITGERIGPIGEVAPYISWAYKDVEKATGIKFGENFLNNTLVNGTAIFTSIPPAIALTIFKEQDPTNSYSFASALQHAIYYEGIEPKNLSAYGRIAAQFNLDSSTFVNKMLEPRYASRAREDFQMSVALGVTGFPSVFVEKDGHYYKISSGYAPLNTLEKNFEAVKNKEN